MIAVVALAAQAALAACTVPGVPGPAACGVHRVWEDRAAGRGRQVPINVIVLKALGPARPDPLVFLQGGPGDAPSFNAGFYNRVFSQVRQARDLVLIDLRGTGRSAALTCPELAAPDASGALDAHMFPAAGVRACRARLERTADLRQYTTAIAADDLDEVLGALGYGAVNLYGTSYGTRLAQVLMARHPARVRTASLKGVVSPSMAMPDRHSRYAENAWQALVARCSRDTACHAAFPSLDADLRALMAELDAKPRTIRIPASPTTPDARLTVTRGLAAEAIRSLLYYPEGLASAPKAVEDLRANNSMAFVQTLLAARTLTGSDRLSAGFFLSVTCAEDIPFLPADAAARSRDTFGGDYRLREQVAACAEWPRAGVPAAHNAPLRSDIPTLLLTGEYDPVTPPTDAAEVARGLTRVKNVVLRNNGHNIGNAEACVAAMIGALIDSGTTDGLDASCADRIPPVPIHLPETKP